jgi:hypothetical protein
MNNELQDLVFRTDRSKLPQNNRARKPKKKAIRGGRGKKKAIGAGRKRGSKARGGRAQPSYQGGGVNISYNPYEAMGLVKNEKG